MAEIRPIRPDGIEWVDSPPTPTRPKVEVVAEQLRANPGQWAVIARRSSSVVAWWMPLRNTPDQFEVETRRSDPTDSKLVPPVDVYARYIGARRDPEGAAADND